MTLRLAIPSMITAFGFLLGLVGIALGSVALLWVSIGFDLADGYAARRLGAVTELGSHFDYATDSVLAWFIALCWEWQSDAVHAAAIISVAMSQMINGFFQLPHRTSGRAAATILVTMTLFGTVL